jgi:hypothetical protein
MRDYEKSLKIKTMAWTRRRSLASWRDPGDMRRCHPTRNKAMIACILPEGIQENW